MSQRHLLPKPFYSHCPWDDNASPLWPATAFYLTRNFAKNLFPAKLTEAQALKLEDSIIPVIMNLGMLQNPTCLRAEDMSAQEKEFLYEHFLCRQNLQNTMKGQAFIVDETAHFLAMINLSDHLQIEYIDCKNKWEKGWEYISCIDTQLCKQKEMAYSERFGFLTAAPEMCGTGLNVSCYLHLPLMLYYKQIKQSSKSYLEESVKITSLQGDTEEYIGDFVLLQNRFCLGITEEMILRDLHMSATKMMMAEDTLRKRAKNEGDITLKDSVSRSYGLLMHSMQLQTKEVLDAISKVKLGINLGWIEGISDAMVNEMFFTCQRAHIGFVFDDPTADTDKVPKKRADYIHRMMQNTRCTLAN
jgi:protein arginine kinase